MADISQNVSATPFVASDMLGPFRVKRLAVALILLLLAIAPGGLGALTREMMASAFVSVSAFVAATLLIFYGVERLFNFDIGTALRNAKLAQVPIAALLGATPGCGGAVVVVAAFSSGHVSFGAVVATLTATMGDAAFLLIATRPDAAAVLLPMSFAVAILSGWIVDHMPGQRITPDTSQHCELAPKIGRIQSKHWLFLAFALPALVVGVSDLANLDVDAIYGGANITGLALAGTAAGLFIWSTSPLKAMTNQKDAPVTRMAEETSFIGVWVIAAFLAYEYLVAYGGLDLEAMFQTVAPLLPLIAIAIGFVPGCGPQILVTTLYINGLIPFAALVGNAISNDGDALFPAIAVNPKAALWATVYSAVPALIVAYGFYWFAPGFMN